MTNLFMTRAKNVLLLTSHYPPNLGGVESHLTALVSALIKRNWKVVVSTYQPLAAKKSAPFFEKYKELKIYRFPWLGFNIVHKLTPYPPLEFLYLFPGLLIMSIIVMLKHLSEIDVIHSQGLVPTAIGVILKVVFRKRLVSSIHNMYFFPIEGLYPKVAKWIFSHADIVLSPTQMAADELIRIGVPRAQIEKFRYWLSLGVFKPIAKSEAKRKLGWKTFSVFFIGRLIETKGLNLIFQLAKVLNRNIQIVIAGDGPLKTLAEDTQGKFPNFKYVGRVENSDLPIYYSAADLVLVPSLVDEGWGFVAMESISCGTPVLAAKVGGLSDVVTAEVGKLIKPSVKELKKWTEYYYQNKKEINTLTKRCRRYALSHFGDNNVESIIRAYEG